MRMSQRAFDELVADEVSSRSYYEKRLRRPEWPGESSGVTVGIGYDLGQTSAATIRSDWQGRVSPTMLEVMVSCSGVTGRNAIAPTKKVKNQIDIPWDVALAVHKERVVPRWEAKVLAALPNAELLSGDCFGALGSLTFNRGPSFRNTGDRYREMRNIRAHMIAKRFDRIDDEIIAMKRLWDPEKVPGLLKRRDREAALWNRGLPFIKTVDIDQTTLNTKEARADELEETPAVEGRTPKPDHVEPPDAVVEEIVVPMHGEKSPVIEAVQVRLNKRGYYMVGKLDGRWGGATAGAIAAFKNDRHLPGEPLINNALIQELTEAENEGWMRPISEERATEIPKGRIVEATEKSGAVTTVGLVGTGVAGLSKASETFQTVNNAIDPLRPWFRPFYNFAISYWPWMLAGVCVYLMIQAAKIRKARVEDHQKGVTP